MRSVTRQAGKSTVELKTCVECHDGKAMRAMASLPLQHGEYSSMEIWLQKVL